VDLTKRTRAAATDAKAQAGPPHHGSGTSDTAAARRAGMSGLKAYAELANLRALRLYLAKNL